MNLEVHTNISLLHPFKCVNILLNINGKYFAVSKWPPFNLDSFMKHVQEYKQYKFLGLYFRTWKEISSSQIH